MTQRDRDRLVVLKKAKKKLIKQSQAARELDISPRQVRRLLRRLREQGDGAVVHALRGRQSNRGVSEETRQKAVQVLSQEVYRDFGPTLAAEYLEKKHGVKIGREESGTPGKSSPAIFAFPLSEDRCSGAPPKQIRSEKPKPPERASYGPV
jgi:transposase